MSQGFRNGSMLFDLKTREIFASFEGNLGIMTRDGKSLITGSDKDFTIKISNVETGKTVKVLKGHSAIVTSFSLSDNEKLLFSGSKDGTVKI